MINKALHEEKKDYRNYVFTAEEQKKLDDCLTRIITENAVKVKLRKEALAAAKVEKNKNKKVSCNGKNGKKEG